jgi:hypothetical protein
MLMAEHLASVAITAPASEIMCTHEEDAPIKVIILGLSEFAGKLASLISPEDSLSLVNTTCEMYQNLPYQNKLEAMAVVLHNQVDSMRDFLRYMMDHRMQDTIAKYYCPLVATVYAYDQYGNLEDYPDEYDGSFLTAHEEKIRNLIHRYDSCCKENLAEYFFGSKSAVAKLKEVHFGTQNVSGILYGCIRAELTEPFTEEEEAEFLDWLEGQCSDGYGEGLEQRPISIDDGDLYVSFWHAGEDYFLLNSDDFDAYLTGPRMGGM